MKPLFNTLICAFAVVGAFVVQYTSGQPPDIEWYRTYGGNNSDEAYSVQQTTDGGYIFAGYTKSFGADSNDVYLVKTESDGDLQWYRRYGGSDYDVAYSVKETSDDGFIVVGRTYSYGINNPDIYTVRTDNIGDTLWIQHIGGTSIEYARSVASLSDGGFILAGCSEPNIGSFIEMYLVKIDSLGDTLWTRTYGGTDDRQAFCVCPTADAGYILVGYNPSYGGNEYDIYLVKTDSLGDPLWTRTFGRDYYDTACEVQQTSDGGYIIAGSTQLYHNGPSNIYLIKTDSLGDTTWTRLIGGEIGTSASGIQQTADGGYIVAGMVAEIGAETGDIYLVRTNDQGDTIWTLTYFGSENEGASSIDRTEDGGYIVSGSVFSLEWPADCILLKTGPDTSATHAPSIEWASHPLDFTLHTAYPNPFNATTVLTYSIPNPVKTTVGIYNVLGERIATLRNGWQESGVHTVTWNAADCASGLYFCRIEANHHTATRKLVLLK